MRRVLAIAAALAFLGACTSGDGGCGAPEKKEDSGQSTGMSGGGSSHGGLGEAVSFQGIGKKPPPPPAQGAAPAQQGQAAPPAQNAAAAAPAAAAAASSSQSVICGGFKDLPSDCFKSPVYAQVKKKCCPSGQVERCEGIPGGARLIGTGCTAVP